MSFRFHAFEQARKLKVTGWVCNWPDGRVELVVAGTEKEVEKMILWARQGPPHAEVKNVEIHDCNERPNEPFFIRRDGGQ